ncbi:hypothetical protein NQ317_001133 [Molorchus minor]|uniref:THAP-type domain-containing protein n=1 Tax=Molorchus minor TaxID=1323400 RepID=A0ABQ9J8Z0_9CUCU|nr:hypothetical protein NQ317_001133 [Molorchus minor]
MKRRYGGHVCTVKIARINNIIAVKKFFRFPSDPVRARIWAISSHREDLFAIQINFSRAEQLIETRSTVNTMCSDHFDLKMFMNQFCERLKHNAIPTIFPSLEGCSKGLPSDHNKYCLPKPVNLVDEEVP